MLGKLIAMIKKHFVFLLIILFSVGGMSAYAQKKSGDTTPRKYRKLKTKEAKFAAAKGYYDKGLYLSAADLFERIYPLYMGSEQGDSILFLFADCYYRNGDYLMAAFHFNDFTRKYPFSPRTEEAAFLAAKAHYMNVPGYNLDQTDAQLAKEGLETFLESYPQSRYSNECNAMLDTIRDKHAIVVGEASVPMDALVGAFAVSYSNSLDEEHITKIVDAFNALAAHYEITPDFIG